MEIKCNKCGEVNNYRTEMKNGQNVAHCIKCGSYIKNIPYVKEHKFYFGKYKDKLISDCQDLEYLQWLITGKIVKANIREAVITQIEKIKLYGQ